MLLFTETIDADVLNDIEQSFGKSVESANFLKVGIRDVHHLVNAAAECKRFIRGISGRDAAERNASAVGAGEVM